jgi:hypothetical protein
MEDIFFNELIIKIPRESFSTGEYQIISSLQPLEQPQL